MFPLVCAWTNSWANNRDACDLGCHCAHYDISVMTIFHLLLHQQRWHPHDMETLPALLALCEGNQLVTGGFHPQRASNAGSVSTSYDHHVDTIFVEGGISQQWWFYCIPHFNEVERGGILVSPCPSVCPSVRPSVCPYVDRIISALFLQQYSLDPFHICTSYRVISKGVLCVMFV